MNINKKYISSSSRRKARSISPEKMRLMVEYFPEIAIKSPNSMLGLEISEVLVKSHEYKNICLEIGFGDGEHLINQAENNPENLYFASELFYNSICSTTLKIYNKKLKNIRIFDGDTRYFLESLAFLRSEILSKIYVLFPDPWPKEKHSKRRLINKVTLDLLNKTLKKDGEVIIASDKEVYINWCLEIFKNDERFILSNELETQKPHTGYITTKYHSKAIEEGREARFLFYKKKRD
ncbi:MAG: tRNA (guanosine(46)-N7)-methyltransferase TrmB [Rickettsiales bacterium]|nr:tRNA (guanosine(46)-N7)-methyltransferase TrmB [Rickettsiales bacterium]